jgi:hypothetical protein
MGLGGREGRPRRSAHKGGRQSKASNAWARRAQPPAPPACHCPGVPAPTACSARASSSDMRSCRGVWGGAQGRWVGLRAAPGLGAGSELSGWERPLALQAPSQPLAPAPGLTCAACSAATPAAVGGPSSGPFARGRPQASRPPPPMAPTHSTTGATREGIRSAAGPGAAAPGAAKPAPTPWEGWGEGRGGGGLPCAALAAARTGEKCGAAAACYPPSSPAPPPPPAARPAIPPLAAPSAAPPAGTPGPPPAPPAAQAP